MSIFAKVTSLASARIENDCAEVCNYQDNYYSDQHCISEAPVPSGVSLTQTITDIVLYMKTGCPYCDWTIEAIGDMDLDIRKRDITRDLQARHELASEGGMVQVPSLRIERGDGSVTWMYESEDIVGFLSEPGEDGEPAAWFSGSLDANKGDTN